MFAIVALFIIILLLVLMHTNAFSDKKPQKKVSHNNHAHNFGGNHTVPNSTKDIANNTNSNPRTTQTTDVRIDSGISRPTFTPNYQPSIHREFDKIQYTISKTIHSNEGFAEGEYAEYDVIRRLKSYGIPPETIFHNLYVEKMGGIYTQVDIVVPIDIGILVFEIKDYKGWIYGDANSKYWTQVLDYGKIKHKFYNPIIQNMAHISALRNQQEQLNRVPFFSIVVFQGTAELKSEMELPDNTFVIHPHEIPKVLKYLRAIYKPAPYTNKWGVMEVFQISVDNSKKPEIVAKHNLRMSRYRNE